MAKGPSYRVPFRRRGEGKTDYGLRKNLIMSGLPRLVSRDTLKHTIVQIIQARQKGDEVLASAYSRELAKTHGWKGGCGNTPAAYLTGLLCGYRAITKGIKRAVLDIGLKPSTKGSRIFATLKGALDAGMEVPRDDSILPDEKRIQGKHIADYAKQLSSDPNSYQRRFSRYLAKGIQPERLPEHFSEVKDKIVSSFVKGEESA